MTGAELERAVAAAFQAAGWFVRRGVRDQSFRAFELDVLGFRFPGACEESVLAEAKGGHSGFGDLWKLLGLKTHLDIGRGVLLADPDDPLHTRKGQLASKHEIAVIAQHATTISEHLVEAELIEAKPPEDVLATWLRCYRVEDALIKVINDKNRWEQYETIRVAKKQLQHLISKVWLEPDPWRQAIRLYALYQEAPDISNTMAHEISGGGARELFRRAMYEGAIAEIQACFYLEHRKRIEVAFAATRCAALDNGSGRWARLAPASFHEMVETIKKDDAWYLPAVLQVYFLGFGSMICLDAETDDFKNIAKQARCTSKQVRRSLELFAELFPYAGGWYYDNFELSRLKLVPVPLRGAGLWMRETVWKDKWTTLATEAQARVEGANTYNQALLYEKTVIDARAKVR